MRATGLQPNERLVREHRARRGAARLPSTSQNGGGAAWNLSKGKLTVTINPATGGNNPRPLSPRLRDDGAVHAGAEGRAGRSRDRGQRGRRAFAFFLGAQLLATNGLGPTPSGFLNSNNWMQSPQRLRQQPELRRRRAGHRHRLLLFIYYLFSQLGFSVNQIVAAGANTLAGVYKNLTGDSSDPFPAFKQLLEDSFPGRRRGSSSRGVLQGTTAFPLQGRGNEPRSHCNSRAPSAGARTPNRLDVFWIGPDRGIGSTS